MQCPLHWCYSLGFRFIYPHHNQQGDWRWKISNDVFRPELSTGSALLWIERERKTSRGCVVMWIKRVAGQTLFSSQPEYTYSYVRTGSYYESKSFKATCLFPSCGCWDGEHWIPNPFFRRLKTTGRGQKSRQFMEEALSSYNHDHHGDSSSPVCLPPPAYVLHLECG